MLKTASFPLYFLVKQNCEHIPQAHFEFLYILFQPVIFLQKYTSVVTYDAHL